MEYGAQDLEPDEGSDDDFESAARSKPKRRSASSAAKKAPAAKRVKKDVCKDCRMPLDSPDLLFYLGHPDGAREEDVALFDPSLAIEDCLGGDALYDGEYFQKPGYRLTNFSVYDSSGHLAPFEGVIARNGEIYASGHLRALTDDGEAVEGAVPVSDLGPLVEWWIAGENFNLTE